jgi:glycosidase
MITNIEDPALRDDLAFLYGDEQAGAVYRRLVAILNAFHEQHPQLITPLSAQPAGRFDQRDSILITYGDMVRTGTEAPLRTLARFVDHYLKDVVGGVHLLPFYPYSSDDGFSVIDYRAVDPALGDWKDVRRVGRHFRLMFDAVINHVSAESAWFKSFLANEEPYRDYFIVVKPGTDLSAVFRPRALPLLTAVQQVTAGGAAAERLVWTTFSADQIDLNFACPDVLLEIVDLMLFYCGQGCDFIRLDAVAFMWKEAGTSSIHLPQTHRIIQLLRRVLNHAAPRVALITETNVPHQDNVAYFGDGRNEAQLVYNFTLPPLTMHAFHAGDASALSRWASTLDLPSDKVTFFNFLASHDGIGLTPLTGILDDESLHEMAERVRSLGGYVSERTRPDGSTAPYELNINYLDALADPGAAGESLGQVARRFLTSQAIMLAMRGVPGIYFHSLFGSRGWAEGVQQTGRARTINRQKLERSELDAGLTTPGTLRYLVYNGYRRLLEVRRRHPAFHPNAEQQVIFGNGAVFALRRRSLDGSRTVVCLHNVSGESQRMNLGKAQLGAVDRPASTDLLGEARTRVTGSHSLEIQLEAYGRAWLEIS